MTTSWLRTPTAREPWASPSPTAGRPRGVREQRTSDSAGLRRRLEPGSRSVHRRPSERAGGARPGVSGTVIASLSAWRNLFWDDVDFDAGTIRWRAANDKKGYEQVVPISNAVKRALTAARRAQRTIGNTPVFPAPKNPAQPCGRHVLDGWLRKAYQLAELTPQPGGMWHSLRRKWATERKGYPVKDVAFAGGWRTERTVLSSYQQADAETVRQVVLHPTQRILSR